MTAIDEYDNSGWVETAVVPEVKIEDLDRLVEELGADLGDEMTAYQLATFVNKVLEAVGSTYRVRPQMMYNYNRNGMIVKGVKELDRFTRIQAVEFTARFVKRNMSK